MTKKAFKLTAASALAITALTPAISTVAETTYATDLLISEYVEGSSNNKAIEIYNGTNKTIDLSAYTIELYANLNDTPGNTQKLVDIQTKLAPGETLVLVNGQAGEALKALGTVSSVTNFNGDDTLVLKNGDTIIDSFGKIAIGTKFAENKTMTRKLDHLTGDTNPTDALDFTGWTSSAMDDFSNLGKFGDNDTTEPPPLDTISIPDVLATAEGTTVQTKGTLIGVLNNTAHIFDGTKAIAVHHKDAVKDAKIGDEIVVKGTRTAYNNLAQIGSAQLVSKGTNTMPQPLTVTGQQIGEDVESRLVTIENIKIAADATGTNKAVDGFTNFVVRDELATGIEAGTTYDSLTGIVIQFGSTYQLVPRSVADVVEDSSVVQQVTASASGLVTKGTAVTLSTTTPDATIYYTTDGSEPTTASTKYTAPIVINEQQTIKAIAVKDGLIASAVSTFDYEVFDGALKIHHLQGEGHTSQFKGQHVENIEGIVTYLFKVNGSFYATMQTPDALVDSNTNTSEGILVYIGSSYNGVSVGDHIKVSGKVDEYRVEGYEGDLLSTQINARNGTIEKIASNVALPNAITVNDSTLPRNVIDNDSFAKFDPQEDAIDYWESIEGMRVAFDGLKATAPQEYGDITTVLSTRQTDTKNGGVLISATDYNADRIHLKAFKENGNAATDFNVSTGDKFNGEQPIIGVVGYGFSNYKVYVDEAMLKAAFEAGNIQPEKTTIVADPKKLTIANYNIENFSANTSETSDAKAKLIAESFVKNMGSPDIIGIVEMQDNDGQTASNSSAADKSYERLIQAIVDAGGPRYDYVNIDPVYNQDGGAPGANIRPGFLYNPERVTLKAGTAGDATTAVTYKGGELSHNPGLINPTNTAFESSRKPIAAQFTFNGDDVVVIANHFNSKGGDSALFGGTQPVVLNSEVQRRQIANQLKVFVESIKLDNPAANIVALGDFNDFEFSKPLEIVESAGMVNMIKQLPQQDRYTYTYQGNSQVLDHILVSQNLRGYTKVDALHINADYSSVSAKRASDHDPVLVQLDLANETVEMPELVEMTLKGKQTGKLILTQPKLAVNVEQGYIIKNGIVIKGHKDGSYIRLTGALEQQTVTIEATKNAPIIVDFEGATVKEVQITGQYADQVTLYGTQNVQHGIQ